MTDIWEQCAYQGIARACFVISLCNGGINAVRSDIQWYKEFDQWLRKQDYDSEILYNIDEWLAQLDEWTMEIVCDGDNIEAKAILFSSPVFTDTLLDAYFNEVC